MQPGKRGMTGKHENHWRRPLLPRVSVTCEVCGVVRVYTPAQARQRTGRFCSKACSGKAKDTRVSVACAGCGATTIKRRDHLASQKAAYCSTACARAARRKALPKWPRKNRPQNIDVVAARGDREAQREYMRQYVAKNRKRHNERGAAWARNNRDKRNELQQARRSAYAGHFPRTQWLRIKREYGFKCLRCQQPETLLLKLEPDHVVPLARGGAHSAENIQPLCRSCNAWKGARTIDYRQRPSVSLEPAEATRRSAAHK